MLLVFVRFNVILEYFLWVVVEYIELVKDNLEVDLEGKIKI